MKTIEINGKSFQYDNGYIEVDFAPGGYVTDFYYGQTEKKTFWGGKKIVPRFAFRVGFDIEDVEMSKEKLKEYLEKDVAEYFQRCERKKEIEKGCLV